MGAGAREREQAPDEWWRCIDKDGNDLREDEYVLTVKGEQEYWDRQHKWHLIF